MMNSEFAIKVENVSKNYHLYDKPIDRLKEALHPFRKIYHRDFFALNDVSFEVKKGECLGILGRNGAGKSTLLKIITGVLSSSSGTVNADGKIASLLELGAGFNVELTGLENIFLNGAIMGFSREEMDQRLEAVLEFADIGEFIQQPVKTYSSGMFARLAFSVAINVDPDILIVDEALSVGDMRFQQKSIRKMDDFVSQGKTVLFVTHDISAVNRFCTKALWLSNGTVKSYGNAQNITRSYMAAMAYGLDSEAPDIDQEIANEACEGFDEILWEEVSSNQCFGEGSSKITHVALCEKDNNKKLLFAQGGEDVVFYIRVSIKEHVDSPGIGILLKNRLGLNVFGIGNYIYEKDFKSFQAGDEKILCVSFKFPTICNGEYAFEVALSDGSQMNHIQLHWVHEALTLSVQNPTAPFLLDNVYVLDSKLVDFEIKG